MGNIKLQILLIGIPSKKHNTPFVFVKKQKNKKNQTSKNKKQKKLLKNDGRTTVDIPL